MNLLNGIPSRVGVAAPNISRLHSPCRPAFDAYIGGAEGQPTPLLHLGGVGSDQDGINL